MKTSKNIFVLLTVFYLVITGVYGYWSYQAYGKVEVIGTAAIGMLVFLSGFIAFYFGKAANSFTGTEDMLEANIEDGEAESGFFAPFSWWPLALGITGAMCFSALAIGWWLFVCAFPLALVALIGFTFEHSRGAHAH